MALFGAVPCNAALNDPRTWMEIRFSMIPDRLAVAMWVLRGGISRAYKFQEETRVLSNGDDAITERYAGRTYLAPGCFLAIIRIC